MVLTSVETFRFDDYKPKTFPEEFHGRKLRFVGKPTHWIVLRTAPPKPKSGEESAPKMGVKVAFAVLQENGQWMIAGSTYAD